MIVYEVNLKIRQTIYDAYLSWLKPHVERMLDFPGFEEAFYFEELRYDASEYAHLIVQYHVQSMEHLDNYLKDYAQAMREDGLKRFPQQFIATRRYLKEMSF